MPPRERPTAAEVIAARDTAEDHLAAAVNRATRGFLRDTLDATGTPDALVAAWRPYLTLGQLTGWWTARVDAEIMAEIRRIWRTAYRDRGILTTSIDAAPEFLAAVRDRLVRGLTPPLPSAAFDAIRATLTRSIAYGWDTRQTAQRIAAELGWETSGPYWRRQLADADRRIDQILDPHGPPGHPVREAARLNDPTVRALQADRAALVRKLDAEGSYWRMRATRIARTEATASYNAGALSALDAEGAVTKIWEATGDSRTRPTHRDADGQEVPIASRFTVGVAALMMPGDPSGPAAEVVDCRCCLLGGSFR